MLDLKKKEGEGGTDTHLCCVFCFVFFFNSCSIICIIWNHIPAHHKYYTAALFHFGSVKGHRGERERERE